MVVAFDRNECTCVEGVQVSSGRDAPHCPIFFGLGPRVIPNLLTRFNSQNEIPMNGPHANSVSRGRLAVATHKESANDDVVYLVFGDTTPKRIVGGISGALVVPDLLPIDFSKSFEGAVVVGKLLDNEASFVFGTVAGGGTKVVPTIPH